ncbi:MAG: DUF6527 family protein [Gemmatimonadota bacterium]
MTDPRARQHAAPAARAARLRFDAIERVAGQGEARATVDRWPGRLAVVVRGIPRSVVFACPCACGDVIVINLDPAVADAWRMRVEDEQLTLLPSVWRTTGCRSHFIVWRNGVWWCRWRSDVAPPRGEPDVRTRAEDEAWPEDMDHELREEWRRIRDAHRASDSLR